MINICLGQVAALTGIDTTKKELKAISATKRRLFWTRIKLTSVRSTRYGLKGASWPHCSVIPQSLAYLSRIWSSSKPPRT